MSREEEETKVVRAGRRNLYLSISKLDERADVRGEALRFIRKKELESALERVRPHPNPKVFLEQYTIPTEIAADLLYKAAYVYDDIPDKEVVDLGCGTGRLAIGALLLGADRVLCVDIDAEAVSIARLNAESLEVSNTEWVIGDIEALRGRFHVTVMNPPFGTKIRHMDRRFLEKALEISEVVYSIHKRSTRNYILRFLESRGARVDALFQSRLVIPWMFEFHRKGRKRVEVDIYRILS